MTVPTSAAEKADTAAWTAGLKRDRDATTAGFADPARSPYATVARHDFSGERPLVFGSAAECDAGLEGLLPRHLQIWVEGDHFRVAALDDSATFRLHAPGARKPLPELREAVAPPGAKLEVGRYVLRLSHQNFPGALVMDPESPLLLTGKPPVWFPPDPTYRVEARLVPDAQPREEIVLSTRGNQRRALRLGTLDFALQGQPLSLVALRLLEPGTGEAAVSIFFRDATTGHESYPVGRYIDAVAVAGTPGAYLLDFNRAYNPSCAFNQLYNCPIPPRANTLPVAVRAGERDPGDH